MTPFSSLLLKFGVDLCPRLLLRSDADLLRRLLSEFGVDLLFNVLFGFGVDFPLSLPLGINVVSLGFGVDLLYSLSLGVGAEPFKLDVSIWFSKAYLHTLPFGVDADLRCISLLYVAFLLRLLHGIRSPRFPNIRSPRFGVVAVPRSSQGVRSPVLCVTPFSEPGVAAELLAALCAAGGGSPLLLPLLGEIYAR